LKAVGVVFTCLVLRRIILLTKSSYAFHLPPLLSLQRQQPKRIISVELVTLIGRYREVTQELLLREGFPAVLKDVSAR
jgi:hypothetical protein